MVGTDLFTLRELQIISAAIKTATDYEKETAEQTVLLQKVDEVIVDRLFGRL